MKVAQIIKYTIYKSNYVYALTLNHFGTALNVLLAISLNILISIQEIAKIALKINSTIFQQKHAHNVDQINQFGMEPNALLAN